MKFPDCIVVGGGLIGLSAAYRMMRRGMDVCVIAQGRPHASLAAAGMLAPGIEAADAMLTENAHPRLGALLAAAGTAWPDFAAELCDHPNDWSAIGYRKLDTLSAGSAADKARLEILAEKASAAGASVEIISGDAARHIEPALAPSVTIAVRFGGDALVEPPKVVQLLRNALRAGGVRFIEGKVMAAAPDGAGAKLLMADGAEMRAGAILAAAGFPGAPLAPELAHIIPIRGQIVALSAARPLNAMLRRHGVYLAPRADGRVDAGATSERGVDVLNIDPDAISNLRDKAGALAPMLAGAWPIAARAGIRPGSPDHAPILGPSSAGGRVFLAAAAHRNGVLLAPLVGEIAAGAVAGDPDAADWLAAFSGRRFDV